MFASGRVLEPLNKRQEFLRRVGVHTQPYGAP